MSAPRGCRSDLDPRYHRLCDVAGAWGVALEALAALGAAAAAGAALWLAGAAGRVQDPSRRRALPTLLLLLGAVLGVFALTFAFLVRLDGATGPARFVLFGALLGAAFACLLALAVQAARLARGRAPWPGWGLLGLALGLSLVQDALAVEYVVLAANGTRGDAIAGLPAPRRNRDFVLLLVFVMALMAAALGASLLALRGPFAGWRRHGAHAGLTALLSMALWAAWIALLLLPQPGPDWDDAVLSAALVANGWLFLAAFVLPEFRQLTKQRDPADYPGEDAPCKPQLLKPRLGLDNRAYAPDEAPPPGLDEPGPMLHAPYSTHFQLQDRGPAGDFSIPRAQAWASPYNDYQGRKEGR
ncbi:retinoic acid-induced protein 3 [Perognathus longimembris pacificus]|uniref:retinoic acid-induced protein 3 n=1 Tax=Perognathus longimembris pacificus TaxID=214514 RepID=UPI002018B7B8|nr:retinoic acid-induced protein 3 [Perognathus longimembris pacificus]